MFSKVEDFIDWLGSTLLDLDLTNHKEWKRMCQFKINETTRHWYEIKILDGEDYGLDGQVHCVTAPTVREGDDADMILNAYTKAAWSNVTHDSIKVGDIESKYWRVVWGRTPRQPATDKNKVLRLLRKISRMFKVSTSLNNVE